MIIVLKPRATAAQTEALQQWLCARGLEVRTLSGSQAPLLAVAGNTSALDAGLIASMEAVDCVQRIQEPYLLAGRKVHPQDSLVTVGGCTLGGNRFHVMAGPCAVESEEQILAAAAGVKAAGATLLRGGAYKPRTSPYAFQGLGKEGITLLCKAREATGLPIVTELTDLKHLDHFAPVDLIQVGARNAQNYELLKELGRSGKPVLLKRGPALSLREWLQSAEYLLWAGNPQVILCERGIRTFETSTRNTLDVAVIPLLKELSHLPVVVDPSHACGRASLVTPLSLAAAAAGCDGLLVEVHPAPQQALSDGAQSLDLKAFASLMDRLAPLLPHFGKTLGQEA